MENYYCSRHKNCAVYKNWNPTTKNPNVIKKQEGSKIERYCCIAFEEVKEAMKLGKNCDSILDKNLMNHILHKQGAHY